MTKIVVHTIRNGLARVVQDHPNSPYSCQFREGDDWVDANPDALPRRSSLRRAIQDARFWKGTRR